MCNGTKFSQGAVQGASTSDQLVFNCQINKLGSKKKRSQITFILWGHSENVGQMFAQDFLKASQKQSHSFRNLFEFPFLLGTLLLALQLCEESLAILILRIR